MTIGTVDKDWLLSSNLIQIVNGWRAMFCQLGFVKAPALDPDIRALTILRGCLEGGDHFLNAVDVRGRTGRSVKSIRNIFGMGMTVDQSRQNRLLMQINRLGIVNLFSLTNPADAAIFNFKGRDKISFAGTDEYLAVDKSLFHS